MEQMTVTEALSEINLIKKKIKTKQDFILSHLYRAKHTEDPFSSKGGSTEMLMAENQSISDLYKRLVQIRSAISKANLDLVNAITIESSVSGSKITKTMHDWIVWKREVYPEFKSYISKIHTLVKNQMDSSSKNPQVFKDEKDATLKLIEYVFHVDYSSVLKSDQDLLEIYEKLDGQLSLKNATVMIEF